MNANDVKHAYIFSDACPTDYLTDGADEKWHTIVVLALATPLDLQVDAVAGKSHVEVLDKHRGYVNYIKNFEGALRTQRLKKWSNSKGYRASFRKVLSESNNPTFTALSFQEITLRDSQEAIIDAYNKIIGGMEGRGIGFTEYADSNGRICMKHEFLSLGGYRCIEGKKNQILVLLIMSWFIAQHFLVLSGKADGEEVGNFALTVVSDKLSGDTATHQRSETNLRLLLDPEESHAPVVLTRSPQSDKFSADLLVDNVAGWLDSIVKTSNPESSAKTEFHLLPEKIWNNWYELNPKDGRLTSLIKDR